MLIISIRSNSQIRTGFIIDRKTKPINSLKSNFKMMLKRNNLTTTNIGTMRATTRRNIILRRTKRKRETNRRWNRARNTTRSKKNHRLLKTNLSKLITELTLKIIIMDNKIHSITVSLTVLVQTITLNKTIPWSDFRDLSMQLTSSLREIKVSNRT